MSIRVSKKHGVNPSIAQCFYCGEESGIVLFGTKYGKNEKAPMHCGVINMEPCSQCAEWMDQGVILISVKDGEPDQVNKQLEHERIKYNKLKAGKTAYWRSKNPFRFIPNPHRTGGWVVVKDQSVKDFINDKEKLSQVLRMRWMFVEDEVWDMLGLPRDNKA